MLITCFVLSLAVGVLSHSCINKAPPTPKCGVGEEYAMCKITCPPQFCNNSYTDYGICPENPPCEPGCNCKKDYLRDFDGKCVYNEDCPPPKYNAPDIDDDECD